MDDVKSLTQRIFREEERGNPLDFGEYQVQVR